LKYPGGKRYLGAEIVRLMVPHRHYVEPFCGSCKVLFARDPNDRSLWLPGREGDSGVSELVNDLDGRLMNFWRVLRDPALFKRFLRAVQCTPFSRVEFDQAGEAPMVPHGPVPDWQAAYRFFVRARQSRAGDFRGFSSLTRNRCRRGVNGNASEWIGAVDGLAAIHARLEPVVIECVDALKLIPREDTPGTLFYCDPPYPHETRSTKNLYGDYEFTDRQHAELLKVVNACKGKVILSGYANPLYDTALSHWRRLTFDRPNDTAGGKTKGRREEVLWLNYDPPADILERREVSS
jgi:DNA adenine methylase